GVRYRARAARRWCHVHGDGGVWPRATPDLSGLVPDGLADAHHDQRPPDVCRRQLRVSAARHSMGGAIAPRTIRGLVSAISVSGALAGPARTLLDRRQARNGSLIHTSLESLAQSRTRLHLTQR